MTAETARFVVRLVNHQNQIIYDGECLQKATRHATCGYETAIDIVFEGKVISTRSYSPISKSWKTL